MDARSLFRAPVGGGYSSRHGRRDDPNLPCRRDCTRDQADREVKLDRPGIDFARPDWPRARLRDDFGRPGVYLRAGTPEAQHLISDRTATAHASHDDLIYLLTTIIRGERFSDGEIAGAYERGTLLAIARRAQALLDGDPDES